jgi:phosphatidylinositol-4,5-bisphosphate 4-phosphatase
MRGVQARACNRRQICQENLHKKDAGEPYKLAQRIALLSQLIGVVPCYNCKSGKDRMGMLDSEIKRESVRLFRHNKPSKLGKPLSNEQQAVFRKVLANGGNLEIQEMNTGAPGNKVLKKFSSFGNSLTLGERIGDRNSFRLAKGASRSVQTGHIRVSYSNKIYNSCAPRQDR